MLSVSLDLQEAVQQPVKNISGKVVVHASSGDKTITGDDELMEITLEQVGKYYLSTAKQATVKLSGVGYGFVAGLTADIAAQVQLSDGTYEDIDYGTYYITEEKIDLEKKMTTLTLADPVAMMQEQIYTRGDFSYPTTVAGLIDQLAGRFGLSIAADLTLLPNYDLEVAAPEDDELELFEEGANTTFRDILDQLAGVTSSIASVEPENLLTFRPTTAAETPADALDYDNILVAKIGETYEPRNTVILARTPQEDNATKTADFQAITGVTKQAQYSGEQLLTKDGMATPITDTNFWYALSTNIANFTPRANGWMHVEKTATGFINMYSRWSAVDGLAADSTFTYVVELANVEGATTGTCTLAQVYQSRDPVQSFTIVEGFISSSDSIISQPLAVGDSINVAVVTTKASAVAIGARLFFSANAPVGTELDVRVTVLAGDHSNDWEDYVGGNWQPYVGGIASPNPDYPQDVEVATGTQTITVNDTDYTLDLGDIELCEIGDYQDYIYHSGGTWYLHKATASKTLDIQNYGQYYAQSDWGYVSKSSQGISNVHGVPSARLSNYFISRSYAELNNNHALAGLADSATDIVFRVPGLTSAAEYLNWAASNDIVFYYALATPTDEEITDAGLLAQLNTILTARVRSVKLANNEIIEYGSGDDDTRRQTAISPILEATDGFGYTGTEVTTEGHGYYEPGDAINIYNAETEETVKTVVTRSKITITGGLKEVLTSEIPEEEITDYATAGSTYKSVWNVQLKTDKQAGQIESLVQKTDQIGDEVQQNYTQFLQTVQEIIQSVQKAGGTNLLKNSVGYDKDAEGNLNNWTTTGTVTSQTSPDSVAHGALSGNMIILEAGASISQTVAVSPANTYVFSAIVSKPTAGVASIEITDEQTNRAISLPDQTEYTWKSVSVPDGSEDAPISPSSNTLTVTITNTSASYLYITDVMLAVGETKTTWSQAANEILNTQVSLTEDGVRVKSSVYSGDYVEITPLGFIGYSAATGSAKRVFWLTRDTTNVSKLTVEEQITMPPLKILPIDYNGVSGWAFVKSEG